MPRLVTACPSYRKHRASGQAVVTLSGKTFYLGRHGTKSSKAEYERLITEWIRNGRRLHPQHEERPITTTEVIAAYARYAQGYYRKNG